MPTKYVAIGAVVLIIAAAIYAYMSYSGSAGQTENSTTFGDQSATAGNVSENAQSGIAPGEVFTGSMADLIARGGDWKCTFDVTNPSSRSMGTVYLSGARMRGDFMSQVPEVQQTVDSHMLQDGGYVYVWTSLAPQGFKTKTALGTPDATTKFNDQGVNINQQYDYNCFPWTVEASMFALPGNVTFIGQ